MLCRRTRYSVAAAAAAFVLPAAGARAQQIVLQRGDTLYAASAAGTAPAHRLLTIANAANALWAASADGRRLACLTRLGAGGPVTGLQAAPALVYVSELGGRHKKRLFSTDTLRDRLGRPVASLGIGDDTGKFEDWEPDSLAWSADGHTLYISCISTAAGAPMKATFAVDAASGAALVDSQDRWKSIAAVTAVDARGSRLVGTTSLPSAPAPPSAGIGPAFRAAGRAGQLLLIDLADGARTPLTPPANSTVPADSPLTDPALSPDARWIAFAAPGAGLYLSNLRLSASRQIVAGSIERPQWSGNGKSIFFLLQRPGAPADSAPVFDLYAIDTPPIAADPNAPPAPLRLVLQGVDWFDVVAE